MPINPHFKQHVVQPTRGDSGIHSHPSGDGLPQRTMPTKELLFIYLQSHLEQADTRYQASTFLRCGMPDIHRAEMSMLQAFLDLVSTLPDTEV